MENVHHWRRGRFEVSTDARRLNLDVIHSFLSESSRWAKAIPRATVEKSLRNSLCFGLYDGDVQLGFARVITDRATVAYLADVFVLPQNRGQGFAKWLVECVLTHPDLQNLRRWLLVTEDAHKLYSRFGFVALRQPTRFMEIHNEEVYKPGVGI